MKPLNAIFSLLSFALLSQEAIAAPLASYEVIYDLVLAGEKASVDVSGASGTMTYSFKGDACNGYTTSFAQKITMTNMEDARTTFVTQSQNFEEPKSKFFRFVSSTHKDGRLEKEVDGQANVRDGHVDLKLQSPKKGDVTLGKEVLFPTQHILKVLEAAQKNESFVQSKVFDGGDNGDKALETLSIIGKAHSKPLEAALQKHFANLKRWPLHISYFDQKEKGETTPAYVLKMDLLENGIANDLVMDYGAFALKAKIRDIKLVQLPPCKP